MAHAHVQAKQAAEEDLAETQHALAATRRQLATSKSYVGQAMERAKLAEAKYQRAEQTRLLAQEKLQEHRQQQERRQQQQQQQQQAPGGEPGWTMQLRHLQAQLQAAEQQAAEQKQMAAELKKLQR